MHQWGSQKYGKFNKCREQISSELLKLNRIHAPNVKTIDQINIKEKKESDEIRIQKKNIGVKELRSDG